MIAKEKTDPFKKLNRRKNEHTKKRFFVELTNTHVIYMTSDLAIFTHVQDVRTMQNARAGRLE